MSGREIWVGLFGLRAASGSQALNGAPGAYVKAMALVESPEELDRKVRAALASEGIDVEESEGIEPLREHVAREGISDEFRELADLAGRTGEVEFGAFHTYRRD